MWWREENLDWESNGPVFCLCYQLTVEQWIFWPLDPRFPSFKWGSRSAWPLCPPSTSSLWMGAVFLSKNIFSSYMKSWVFSNSLGYIRKRGEVTEFLARRQTPWDWLGEMTDLPLGQAPGWTRGWVNGNCKMFPGDSDQLKRRRHLHHLCLTYNELWSSADVLRIAAPREISESIPRLYKHIFSVVEFSQQLRLFPKIGGWQKL